MNDRSQDPSNGEPAQRSKLAAGGQIVDKQELWQRIFDSIYNGAIVTDPDGYIIYFNKPYGGFLGLDPSDQIGKHVTEVIENTRMHIVTKTGKAEINETQWIKGRNMVVQRIPIFKDGRVIAAFGQVMFKDVRDVGKLANKLTLLESKVKHYEQELLSLRSTKYTFTHIVGHSDVVKSLKKEARKAAQTQLPVLITGESGTGKELFAQAIHHSSRRRLYPFIRINCAAIPRDLMESELFGYAKGAFTGAKSGGKPGKFELANRGTIFLDEIGDLPLEMQPKLLRVLEEKEFERVGGTKPVRSDFRVIAASNQNIKKMMEDGRFRGDLYYRLSVIPLHVPPLRERREDILAIAQRLLEEIGGEQGLSEIRLDPKVCGILERYDWPGNVRELRNVLERAVSIAEGTTISRDHLPYHLRQHSPRSHKISTHLKEMQAQTEKELIRDTLAESGYNKSRAARLLGIHRTVLYKKMKKYKIPLENPQRTRKL